MKRLAALIILLALAGIAWLFVPRHGEAPEIDAVGDPTRGEYVLAMGGCVACHTDEKNDGALLAGGRALATPFGTFTPPTLRLIPRLASAGGPPANSCAR